MPIRQRRDSLPDFDDLLGELLNEVELGRLIDSWLLQHQVLPVLAMFLRLSVTRLLRLAESLNVALLLQAGPV